MSPTCSCSRSARRSRSTSRVRAPSCAGRARRTPRAGRTRARHEEAFQLASLRFTRGLSTQLEVSDAQLALLTAQSTEARATYDLFLASADLARALGRPDPAPADDDDAVAASEIADATDQPPLRAVPVALALLSLAAACSKDAAARRCLGSRRRLPAAARQQAGPRR